MIATCATRAAARPARSRRTIWSAPTAARSIVRERLGIAMSGTPALTYTTNVIFRCPDFSSLHDKGKGYRFIFIGPEGTWLTIVAINGADRFRMSIVGSAEKVNHNEEPTFGQRYGAPWARISTTKSFRSCAGCAGSWWPTPTAPAASYISGDAAHLTSPTGALGMNTGIQDIVDLGWKLDAVLQGWGGPHLLETYEIERRPVAVRNV